MKALLLAAGLGTRLRPFTFFRAKVSIPLLNVPFIHYPLQYLFLNQIEEVVINLHAYPETVRQAAGKEYHGVKIQYSHEPAILGTAGAIWKASSILGDDPFVVLNGDMITYIPLHEVLEQHTRENADVTLVIMRSTHFSQYGVLCFEEPDSSPPRLSGFQPGIGQQYHYTGLQVINPRIIGSIPPNQKSDIFRDVYPKLIQDRRVHGFVYDGFWMEVGTLRDYLNTSLELIRQPLPLALQPPGIDETLISPKATIEESAIVHDSVIMEGATIKKGARVERSIIGWDTTVTNSLKNAALVRGIIPWYIH